MQRTAQDWLVLTELTHNSAAAVGTVMGVLALGLGLLTVTGIVRLWHVYVFALLLGCATAFDSPANQIFVTELVGEEDLTNAVALNSTSYNTARMTGPALAGVLIASLGTGWAFLVNAASFVAVVGALGMLRVEQLHRVRKASRAATGGLADGFRYVWGRPDLQALLLMVLLIGTFGALLAAGRKKPQFTVLIAGAGWFGLGCALAAITPAYWLFAFAMMLVGVAAVTFTNSSNSLVQLSTEPAMRGRVMAIRLAIIMGGTPLGAPIAGWVADRFGPRWALAVGAASGVAAVIVGVIYLAKFRNLRVSVGAGRVRFNIDSP
jgi:MFS family permease